MLPSKMGTGVAGGPWRSGADDVKTIAMNIGMPRSGTSLVELTYPKSVGRRRRYQPWIAPLVEALADEARA